MNFWQVTIDGPAASGKSVAGKWLAEQLHAQFIDTGIYYRAFAWWCLSKQINPADTAAITQALAAFSLAINPDSSVIVAGICVNSVDLQALTVTKFASQIATKQRVRDKLTRMQRQASRQQNSVLVGRDAGSVILPAAACKIFLTASVAKRAERRYLQNIANHLPSDLELIKKGLTERDQQDTHRSLAPLIVPAGAQVLDNSLLTIAETNQKLLSLAKAQIFHQGPRWQSP